MLANKISQAITIMQHGGVIAYSTETVLGLGCDPYNKTAVSKLLWLKNRAIEKGLIVLVADIGTLKKYSMHLEEKHIALVEVSENTTWLLPAADNVPTWLTGNHNKIAIRVSKHIIAGQLAAMLNGVVSTSANVTGYKTFTSKNEIRDWFGPHLDFVIIDKTGSGVPSKICDLLSGKVIRSN